MNLKQVLSLTLGLVTLWSASERSVIGEDLYTSRQDRGYNRPYQGAYLGRIAFPLGGIGAGMVCLEGSGCLSHVSIRHQPEIFHEPLAFAAVSLTSPKSVARVLEGPVPSHKVLLSRDAKWRSSGNGAGGTTYGLPRFQHAEFAARFPFATVKLADSRVPLDVELIGWSPSHPLTATIVPCRSLRLNTGSPIRQTIHWKVYFLFTQKTSSRSRGNRVHPFGRLRVDFNCDNCPHRTNLGRKPHSQLLVTTLTRRSTVPGSAAGGLIL